MSENKTNDLIKDFIDNNEKSFKTLELLIQLNQKGLAKCFEWSEKSETKLSGLINLFDVINKKQDGNSVRIEKLENISTKDSIYNQSIFNNLVEEINSLRGQLEGLNAHISKVHDLVNLEDRITACDVLNRLTLLENQCKNGYEYQKGIIDGFQERIKSLEFHKNLQINENRKVSKRLDEISNYISRFEDDIHDLQVFKSAKLKTPHKCPVCEGLGGTKISGTIDEECHSCQGKGIVWG